MKNLLLILLCLPMIGFGQINEQSPLDALINIVLEGASNYFEHKNDLVYNNDLKFLQKSVDWNSSQLIKWKVIAPKDSFEIVLNLRTLNNRLTNK